MQIHAEGVADVVSGQGEHRGKENRDEQDLGELSQMHPPVWMSRQDAKSAESRQFSRQ
ncbi:MAG: hypothetical protein JNJ49_16910 [Bdellovibrionaceae bacterium]|nr:hypothetical protein [Pseudobdellovibrionaceae bacterium]